MKSCAGISSDQVYIGVYKCCELLKNSTIN